MAQHADGDASSPGVPTPPVVLVPVMQAAAGVGTDGAPGGPEPSAMPSNIPQSSGVGSPSINSPASFTQSVSKLDWIDGFKPAALNAFPWLGEHIGVQPPNSVPDGAYGGTLTGTDHAASNVNSFSDTLVSTLPTSPAPSLFGDITPASTIADQGAHIIGIVTDAGGDGIWS